MKALRYTTIGAPPEIVDIPKPTVGPGQVLLKVTAAGVCHSDNYLMGLSADQFRMPLPLTLGHEGAGTVAEVGAGVLEPKVGDSVAVFAPWGCGRCHNCAGGREQLCTNAVAESIAPPGLGSQGSMAEYMLIPDARYLVPLGELDPVRNVALTDAGLTPYHAIKQSVPKLGAGTTALVLGAGGLGHIAIQILRAMTSATIIALDISEEKLTLAKEVGAHHTFFSDDDAVANIRNLTGGLGVDAVFDFAGAQQALDIGVAAAATNSDIWIVAVGGGTIPVRFGSVPYDAAIRTPYWGSRAELLEVLELARRGQISVEIERFDLSDGAQAYAKLHDGQIRGRAVLVPES
jgi:propanol-preferring alcohol dehydrogenase